MRTTAVALLLAAAVSTCGGEKPAATRAGAIPQELTGTWEARTGGEVWTLKFLGTGGKGNGPSVFLSSDRAGELVGPISLSGGQITLEFEPSCKKYRFEITDRSDHPKLYLQPDEELGGCPSTEVGSVLAARGWTRPGAPTSASRFPASSGGSADSQ